MSLVEAISSFKSLEEHGLLFRQAHQGAEVYLMHEAKEHAWEEFLTQQGDHARKPIGISTFIIEVVCFGAVSTGIWVLGEQLDNHGWNKSGTWVNFLAFVLFLAVVPIGIQQRWPRLRRLVALLFSLFVILGAFGWFVISKDRPASNPEGPTRDVEKMNKALGGFKKDTAENSRKIDALNEKVDRLIVILTSPTNGGAVGQTIVLAANAKDNTGDTNVTKVEFYNDGAPVPIGIATGSPYSISFDTTIISNGRHSFSAKAYDAAGNVVESKPVVVTVSNAVPGR